MALAKHFPVLIAYPRRAPRLMMVVAAAIGLSISAGGVLGRLLNGAWASLFTLIYTLIFAACYLVIHRGLKALSTTLKPVLELNDEEIIHFPSGIRIAWATIVDLAQRRTAGRWVVSIRYIPEEELDRIDSFDLPLSGMTVSGHRIGRRVRQQFEALDTAEASAET